MKNHLLSLSTALLLAVCLTQPALAGGKKKAPHAPQSAAAQPSPPLQEPEMVTIPAGSFEMGCLKKGGICMEYSNPVHRVSFNNFEMSATEVTQGLWKAVMGNNPSHFKECGDNCPVEMVSWNDVQVFITKLNARTGKHYRLPSEAEWEYACYADHADHAYCGGNDLQELEWPWERGGVNGTHPVATKPANDFGLYDMTGNVGEMVQDWWHDDYKGAPATGRAWESGDRFMYDGTEDNKLRVSRGRPWGLATVRNGSGGVRHEERGSRIQIRPDQRSDGKGFRLARSLP